MFQVELLAGAALQQAFESHAVPAIKDRGSSWEVPWGTKRNQPHREPVP